MAKAEWGTKRTCPETGKRFYDLNKAPIISPYTGKEIDQNNTLNSEKKRSKNSQKIKETNVETPDEILNIEDEDLILEGEDDSTDIDDNLLEEEEADTVPLEDITDVPTSDSEEN